MLVDLKERLCKNVKKNIKNLDFGENKAYEAMKIQNRDL